MPYTDQQRAFYSKAKAAGWAPEKIKAGLERLGARAAAQQQAPTQAPTEEAALPSAAVAAPPTEADYQAGYKSMVDDSTNMENFLAGMGAPVQSIVTGSQQILANMLGDEEWKKSLQEDAEFQKKINEALFNSKAGMAGNLTGNVAMMAIPGGAATKVAALPKVAQFGLPATMAAEGLIAGALPGALAATTEEGERTQNALIGGALGGLMPAAGAGARALIGKADPAMKQAAGVLQRYGIRVPGANQSPGAISRGADYLLENTPLINNISAGRAAKNTDKAREALFKMLGKDVPETNEAMMAIKQSLGNDIGAMTKGKSIPAEDIGPGIRQVLKDYNLLTSQKNRHVVKQGEELLKLADAGKNGLKNVQLKSEAYQTMRSQMSADARTATGAHAQALRGMRDVLDNEFMKTLSPEDVAKRASLNEKYRLANILSKVDINEAGLNLGKARAAVEREARRGPVMPEARELLNAVDKGIPKIRTSGYGTPGIVSGLTAVAAPIPMAKALVGGAAAKGILNTEIPQKVINDATVRKMTAAALRGARQKYVTEED